MQAPTDLRAMADKPFELLLAMERRSRAAAAGQARGTDATAEQVGIGVRIGDEPFLVPRGEVREVLTVPPGVARVPGAKPWLRGLANIRGQLLPLIDLKHFFGGGVSANSRHARVLSVNHRDVPAGLLVDEVLGFRRFSEGDHRADAPQTVIRCERFLQGHYERGGETWPLLSLKELVESDEFLRAAETGAALS